MNENQTKTIKIEVGRAYEDEDGIPWLILVNVPFLGKDRYEAYCLSTKFEDHKGYRPDNTHHALFDREGKSLDESDGFHSRVKRSCKALARELSITLSAV